MQKGLYFQIWNLNINLQSGILKFEIYPFGYDHKKRSLLFIFIRNELNQDNLKFQIKFKLRCFYYITTFDTKNTTEEMVGVGRFYRKKLKWS